MMYKCSIDHNYARNPWSMVSISAKIMCGGGWCSCQWGSFYYSSKGKPTWKGVVVAMSARGAGENPAAAEKLAKLCAEGEFLRERSGRND